MESLKLYLVTDTKMLEGRDYYKCIEDALRGGVTMLQLREKECDGADFLEKAYRLRAMTKRYGVDFIINDRVDIAQIVDADGVHVGQSDIPASEVRKLVGNGKIVGVSARTYEEAKKAKEDGADYIGVGALFGTTTKLDARNVGVEMLKSIKGRVDIPIVGIGGINLQNVSQIKSLGIDGYAVISSILKAEDIYEETRKWIERAY